MSKLSVVDRIAKLFAAKDEDAVKTVLQAITRDEEMEGESTSMSAFDARMKKVEDWMDAFDKRMSKESEDRAAAAKDAEEKESRRKAEEEEKAKKEAEDAILSAEELRKNPEMFGRVWVGDAVTPATREILSRAEILAPGSVPTTDAVSPAALKTFIRTTLHKVAATEDGAKLLAPLLRSRSLESMDGRALYDVFTSAAELVKYANGSVRKLAPIVKTADFGKPTSPEAINKANADFWAKQKKA